MKNNRLGQQGKTSGFSFSSEWMHLIFFTVIYWLTARVGLLFVLHPEGMASLSPISGLALATLLWVEERARSKYAATIFAANFLANFTGGNTVFASLGFATANVAEAVLGWWAFSRIVGRPQGFSTIKEVWALIAAAIFANGFTALLGAAVHHLAFSAPYWLTWELWWIADGLGMILVAPFLISWLTWKRSITSPPTLPRLIEGAVIILFTLATILFIFRISPTDIPIINRPYVLFLLVIWMAIRFETRGASCISLLISLFFLGNLVNPLGAYPWGEATQLGKMLQTQGYLMMLNVVGLVVAASVSSMRLSEGLLQEEKEELQVSEEVLRRNQGITERLAQEMEIIAEIGKVIASTLKIEEIYERFATEVRKLIPFDRIAVNLHDLEQGVVNTVYTSGDRIDKRQPGDTFSLKGSVSEVVVQTRVGMFSHPSSVEEMDKQFPGHSATIQAGMRSLLCVPLISRDRVIASLHFRSKKPNAYTEQDLRLAERIGEQIAGAIANAQLYAGLKKTEQELKESEQRYRELSTVDDLTQLYNSRHFYVQLKSETERSNRYGQPLTLLMLDLDNFKAFNDTYGHVEGDQVLSRLGRVVKRCLRETDSAYRYGGEEFMILLPMTTGGDGAVTAERIRTEFRKETFSPTPGQEAHMTVSIGLAQYKTKEELKMFVQRVDQWMYQGKKDGKDRVSRES